ncbi:MAG: efflux RND transporter periplasmic adaptor subunit [Alphaproteobacteria bacterium]
MARIFSEARLLTKRRIVMVAGALVALAAIGYAATSGLVRGAQPKAPPPAAPVVTASVARADIPVTVHTIGNVQPIKSVAVKSRVDGQITAVSFKEGQIVKAGDPLFTIDPRTFEANVRQAEANLARDKAQLEKAKWDVARYTELAKKEFLTKQQFEQARTTVETLAATIKADEAALDNAKLELSYTSIRAPIQGRTGSVLVNLGNVVKANDPAPLVVINQIQPIYVAFSVAERYLPEIKARIAGGKLMVSAAAQGDPSAPEQGDVSFVNNAVDAATGTILLKATFQNANERLTTGQSVNVTLTLSTLANAVVVPTEAIQNGPSGPYVYVVKQDMTVEQRPVTAGVAHEGMTVIEKGLDGGEQVVTDGQLRLVPGSRVRTQS